MIVAAVVLSATRASAAAIAAGSEARAVMIISHEIKIGRKVESGAETEIKVLMLKQTEEASRAQEPCATARRG